MSWWPDFKTVEDYLKHINLNNDCSKLCYGCKRLWREIATGMVHLVDKEDRVLPCGLHHAAYCDECYEKEMSKTEQEKEFNERFKYYLDKLNQDIEEYQRNDGHEQ